MTGINPDDSLLWLRQLNDAKQGDKEAMGAILQAFWQSLWNHASSNLDLNLQPKKAASDLIQDTFLDAQNSFSHFHGSTQEELRTWLLAILVNNMKDAWRRHVISQKREVSREIGTVYQAEHKNLEDTFAVRSIDVAIEQERKTKVLSILSQMPAHYQSVIRMRHFDSMSFESIAISLDKSPDAVRQMWYRSLKLF